METDKNRKLCRWLGLILVLGTLATYWRVSQFGFVDYDDQEYVRDNPRVQFGLSIQNIGWAFTEVHSANWHPLTWISHMVDCQLFGLDAGAHHVINLILHVINALLLFVLLRQMTGAVWRSAIVAGLFALHPAHVESVAWISERKDVLSTMFALLALSSYVRAVKAKLVESSTTTASSTAFLSVRNGWLALVFYALSLLSKGMYVTLPFLLLLLDYWPLRRFASNAVWREQRTQLLRLAVEKWPWFLLCALVSVATFFAQKTSGAVVGVSQYSFGERLANALVAYARYLGKLIWPVDLAVIYPLPPAWTGWQIGGAAVLLVVLTTIAVLLANKRPYVFVGWAWFLGILVPVIGLVQVGSQSMADRYTYFSFIGLSIVLVWLAGDLGSNRPQLRQLCVGICVLILCACAFVAHRQINYWASSRALFERAVTVTRDNAQAQSNLGAVFEKENRLNEAERHYAEAVRIQPDNPEFRTSLGVVLARSGNTNAAREHLGRAADGFLEIVRQRPDYAAGFNGIGIALSAMGEYRDAADAYARAMRLKPKDQVYRNNLGVALARTGDLPGAIAEHREVLRINPRHADAASNLGAELVSTGQLDEALPYLELAVRLNPKSSEAHSNLGSALARKGDHTMAIQHYKTALELKPQQPKVHLNMGIALNKVGQLDESTRHFADAVQLEPDNLDAQYNLGRNLFLQGKAPLAIAPLELVLKNNPENAFAHFYIGQASCKLRLMNQAIAHLRESIRLRPNWPEALTTLAWILAADPDEKYRNGAEAVTLIEQTATVPDVRQPAMLDALAAAYAEAGRFESAVTTAQQALTAATRLGQTNLSVEIASRRELYTNHQPYRSSELTSNLSH